jgi:predicted transcriptional regulator YheO
MINEYAIYDMKDNEQLVYMGTMKGVADYLKMSRASLYSYITHKKNGEQNLVKYRYEIVRV